MLLGFALIAFLGACHNGFSIFPGKNGAKTETVIYSRSELALAEDAQFGQSYEIVEGDYTVFKYTHSRADKKNVADDEYSDEFLFQVEPETTDFSYQDEEILQYSPFFTYHCFCPAIEKITGIEGSLTGSKNASGNWKIKANLDISYKVVGEETEQKKHLAFSEKFK